MPSSVAEPASSPPPAPSAAAVSEGWAPPGRGQRELTAAGQRGREPPGKAVDSTGKSNLPQHSRRWRAAAQALPNSPPLRRNPTAPSGSPPLLSSGRLCQLISDL